MDIYTGILKTPLIVTVRIVSMTNSLDVVFTFPF